MSPLRRALVSLVAVLGIVLVGVVVLASIDQRALTERVVGRVIEEGSETLGREITIDGARGRLLPDPRVTITGLAVAGRPGEPPLVEVEELRVHLRTWPIVRSLGREIVIHEVSAVRPELHLIRDAEGSWSFEGLGDTDADDEGSVAKSAGSEEVGPHEVGAEDAAAEVTLAHLSVLDGTVHVIDHGAPGRTETAVALTHVDLDAELPGGELSRLGVRGAFASDAPNLAVDLAIAPRGSGSSTALPAVRGSVELRGAELVRLGGVLPAGISRVLRGGAVDLDAEVETREDGTYEVRSDARLDGVRMRGKPAMGAVRLEARIDPASPSAYRAEIQHASLRGPGVELSGSATITGEPRSVTFDVRGPLLDLDVLLAALPSQETATGRVHDDGAVLPPGLRSTLEASAASGTLRIERVVRGPLELHDLSARARLGSGVLELEEATARVHGGRIVASGTQADLRPALPAWKLDVRLEGVDLGSMMQQTAGDQALTGTLDATLDVTGAGAAWDEVRSNVRGSGTVRLRDGELTTGDVGARAAEVLARALEAVGRGGGRVRDVGRGRTELRDLRVAFTVGRGSIVLRDPLTVDAPFGSTRLDGRIGLDRSLDLSGTVVLSPDFVDEVAGVRPAAAIDVPLTLGGTLSDPAISIGAPERLASELVEHAVREGARQLEEVLGGRVQDELRDLRERLPIPGFD